MCSIIGYLGKEVAAPIIVKGLKKMEYRGHDSVGIATESDNTIKMKKGLGRVTEVNSRLQFEVMPGNAGIGHTRWATHGKITDANAHPHASNSGRIAIVHNGVIENFDELKKELVDLGYYFKSDTDSEVIANILQKNHQHYKDVKKAIIATTAELKGHYSFIAMFEGGQMAAARFHKPLIIGLGKESYFLASDVLGFIEHTDDVIYMDNCNVAIVNKERLSIAGFDGGETNYKTTKVSKEFADADKEDYAHFTLKEISEQPQTIINAGTGAESDIAKAVALIKRSNRTYITGSGTSYNAASIGRHLFSEYTNVKAEHIMASELPFISGMIEADSTLIAISQSGESADILEAVNIARGARCKIIAIVNNPNSSLVRESDVIVKMNCGPEIGVAATKSFTAQIIILYRLLQEITNGKIKTDSKDIACLVRETLENQSVIKKIAIDIKGISDIYVLGRGIHYPIATEAALKLKELTYIHAEGIPGGELKHGPLALIDSNVFVIIINPHDSTYTDTITSMMEIKARGAKIVGISDVENDSYDYWVKIPKARELAHVISEIVPIQLLSYYAALEKDADPDYPRNLVKSVTVK